jgi:hypothetical protein
VIRLTLACALAAALIAGSGTEQGQQAEREVRALAASIAAHANIYDELMGEDE